MSAIKKVPIEIEGFKKLIDKNCYFVDKTLMIKDLLDSGADVTLFTRLKKFGKTLNLSMIQRFFEKTEESNAYLLDKMVDLIRSVFESMSRSFAMTDTKK